MSEQLEANENYDLLSDDDVFQFDNGNTSTVGKLKELFRSQFWGKFLGSYRHQGSDYPEIKTDLSLISLDSAAFVCGEIQWKSTEVSCKLLKVSSTGWQQGKLKIQTNVVNSSRKTGNSIKHKDIILDISVEFYSDLSPEITPSLELLSPLDEIRQSEEYKKIGQ